MTEARGVVRRGDRLAGKVAIVTGAGWSDGLPGVPGTGAATAILLAAQGARIGLMDRLAKPAERTLERIAEEGGEAVIVRGDVTVAKDCRLAAESVVERFGRLDVLINNAGIASGGTVVDVSEETWDRVMGVNLKSIMLMSKYAVPHLRRAGSGSIINVSSVAALRGAGSAAYAASKGGVISLTRDMAFAHGREGIRVNCIVPGHLYTPIGMARGPSSGDLRGLRQRASLLDTEGTAWDVAWAAVFLASEESRFVTATMLPVDGGTTSAMVVAMARYL